MHHLEVKHITKIIKGNKVLDDINLSLNGGNIYGIVGKNGSGKTMLFRALSGLIRLSEGKVIMDDKLITPNNKPCRIGIILENSSLYPEFTGLKNLLFLANINNYIDEEQVRNSIKRLDLNPDDNRIIKKYSLGMKQRIAIAQSIMEKPDLLLLDEPTNALDAKGVQIVRSIIKEEANRGAIVFIASHNADDIRLLCNHIFFIENGRIMEVQ